MNSAPIDSITHSLELTSPRESTLPGMGKKLGIVGYTAGAFDVFHIGHLNLLKRAREKCDYLIVGVTTDELVLQTKNKRPLSTLEERMSIIASLKYVNQVVVQDNLDKVQAWYQYKFDILFSGDDWKNTPRWKEYEAKLQRLGAKVIYFPYTQTISSTRLRDYAVSDVKMDSPLNH